MMNLSKNEKFALNKLLKSSNGLDAFTFFKKSGLSFPDFIKIIDSLSQKGAIEEIRNDFYKITLFGKECILKQKSQLNNRHWRTVPERFLGKKITTDSFYMPSIKLLDKTAFKIKDY